MELVWGGIPLWNGVPSSDVPPLGEHTCLNPLHLKPWAAAMSAGDATKHEPPNHPAFDGAHNGSLPGPKL
ncbi:hypothetical protein K443DRAFT_3875 [Laccaria amethystina LaAM-08-1]|uniref:Unplaced genomic scaffold K443scaffold_25, whole genome shotgun sequence n=1 Tax=Laccaria amethystina LaAM-08-1 TaxID=1095629 RepID=A0A0C9XK22_9AGAR|nr:hypothetical protein K443DRAFT_3875 [Laccaria amethystina LaAM-08-1]